MLCTYSIDVFTLCKFFYSKQYIDMSKNNSSIQKKFFEATEKIYMYHTVLPLLNKTKIF